MKPMTRVFALLLAVMMVFSLTVTAMGVGENYKITITGQYPGHTYEAYQVFKGDYIDEVPVWVQDDNGTHYKLKNGGSYEKISELTEATYKNYVGGAVVPPAEESEETTVGGETTEEGGKTTYTATKYKQIMEDVYTAAENGTWYKLKEGGYTETEPDSTNYTNYEGVVVEGEGGAATYTATKYTKTTQPQTKKELRKIEWGAGVNGDALLTALKGTTYVLYVRDDNVSDDNTWYKLKNGTYTQDAPSDSTSCNNYVGGKEIPSTEEGGATTYTATKYAKINMDIEMFIKDGKSIFAGCDNAADVANVIKNFTNDQAEIDAFADIVNNYLTTNKIDSNTCAEKDENTDGTYTYTIDGLDAGYYFIKDRFDANDTKSTYTKYMLEVVQSIEVTAKADKPTIDKDIVEENIDKDYNEANIGDKVEYKIDTNVPEMNGYKTYTFRVVDTMSEGLTFNDDISITLNGRPLTSPEDYTVKTETVETTSTKITIDFVNFIQYKNENDIGAPIVISYSATVNENAKIGVEGNENSAKLVYSRDPNWEDNGDPENREPTGETPDSKTYTYVTAIELTKIDKDTRKTLTGAKFKISGLKNEIVVVNGNVFEEAEDGTYYRLKDGTYTETAPTEETGDSYESTETKYKKIAYIDTETEDTPFVAEGYVDENGILKFAGLGAGTYTITELIAPSGYNSLKDPIVIDIACDLPTEPSESSTNPTCTWKWKYKTEDKDNYKTDNSGIIKMEVENSTGSTLPSTGGIGTTIFYVLGGMLAVGAVVILVTKKRMSEDNAK